MRRAEEFEQLRPLLFSIAYRILGSVSEAEDAVQETWLRYEASPTQPASTKAFLSATVSRIAIDVLRSARVRREEYAGQWFPEPLLDDPYEDPQRSAELADSVSMAALLLLERLSPLERAVFVLREVFAFTFPDIASVVGRSEAACRQLAVRARRHMDAGRTRFRADRRERAELAERFFGAFRDGDLGGLRELLAADVQMVGDSGGKAPRWGTGVFGADNVARVLASIVAPFLRIGGIIEPHEVNGQPGAIFRDRDGRVVNTLALDILDGQIQTIRAVINPDKLRHLGPVADAWVVVREANQARHGSASAMPWHRSRPGGRTFATSPEAPPTEGPPQVTCLVRRIAPGEWRELRTIRLEAVRESPTAFSSSYADVAAYTDAYWQENAADEATSETSATFIACDENGNWVGTASVGPLVEVPDHAHIHAVYVSPAHRGPTGLAARLMEKAIRFAQDHIDVSQLTVGVHENNARALAFYRRIGFETTGKVIPYRPNPAETCYILAYKGWLSDR